MYDPELADLIALAMEMRPTPGPRGDWQTRRSIVNAGFELMESMLPAHDDVERTDHEIASYDGALIGARWYRPRRAPDPALRPAVLHVHGGGMISGSVDLYDRVSAGYVADSGVPMLSVEYRLAPEHPHPAPVEDVVAALGWLHRNVGDLGIDPRRIAIMGDSAGGGLAAGATLLARARGLHLAQQILIYPMLDDRTTGPNPDPEPFGWDYDDNFTGWQALLGESIGTSDVDSGAAPAREDDLRGLPPTYIEVGALDIFCDESIDYARRIAGSNGAVELHVHAGCPHGFDRLNADAAVARRARADRLRILETL